MYIGVIYLRKKKIVIRHEQPPKAYNKFRKWSFRICFEFDQYNQDSLSRDNEI